MDKPDYLISTPENVDLHLELAGLGNRITAALIDHLIVWLALLAVVGACIGAIFAVENMQMSTEVKTYIYYYLVGAALLLLFMINFGYFIVFEGLWQGQTPGKRAMHIRAIEQNGQPIGWSSVWIRNLIRVVDELPLVVIGVLPMMIDNNERRLGDMAAGTVVIRERLQPIAVDEADVSVSSNSAVVIDTGQINPDEYTLLSNFLKRRRFMSASARQRLASDISMYFMDKLSLPTGEAPEALIQSIFIAYKQRAELEQS